MNLEVVICHFQENLDWISELKHPCVIYNKNPKNVDKFENNLPNIGFDTYTYLTYIIDRYDNLPDYVCFAQDYPFDHCSNFIDLVNDFKFDKPFQCLGIGYERTSTSPERNQNCALASSIMLAERLNISYTLPIKFISSAQCIVSKELILKRHIESYKQMYSIFPTHKPLTYVNYLLEYLWPTILNFNDEVPTKFHEQYDIKLDRSKSKH